MMNKIVDSHCHLNFPQFKGKLDEIVKRALDNGIKVVPIPGASAVTSIISVAGIPSEKFIFQGFPPRKGRKRILLLQELRNETKASIFFESVISNLAILLLHFGNIG